MEILIVGIHTRPAVFSAKDLGYRVYSIDYFGDVDLKEKADVCKSIINQEPYKSTGRISENYSDEKLIQLAEGIEADITILTSTLELNKSSLVGTSPRRMKKIKDKWYQLKKVQNLGFKIPRSEIVRGRRELVEIAKEYDFPLVLKPVRGDGGKGIKTVKNFAEIPEIEDKMIVQEYIEGKAVSVSTLSTKEESMALSTSKQILGSKILNQRDFGYCGNIVPFPCNKELYCEAEEISRDFGVIGWNGIDFVLGKEPVFMEINPRFQGTFDCVERAYGINLLDAHIRACEGELIPRPRPRKSSARMTLFAGKRSVITGDLRGISYDVPRKNVIIEEGEPITTVLSDSIDEKTAVEKATKVVKFIYKNFVAPLK